MKIVLATSEVTYIPQNYTETLRTVFESSKKNIVGVVVVRARYLNLLGKVVWLYSVGCSQFASTLLKNLLGELFLKKRKRFFRLYGIDVKYARGMNDREVSDWLKDNNVDLLINMRTRCIFKKDLLEAPRLGCINVHHGILPKYRGLFCDLYAIGEGRKPGFTIHEMTQNIDAGKIFLQKEMQGALHKNYIKYLGEVSMEEGKSLANFIGKVVSVGVLPKGNSNSCKDPVMHSTPSKGKIKELKKAGVIL